MIFNRHSGLAGKHAFLSPSSPHWINYDEQKLLARWYSFKGAVRGTDLHDLAHHAIRLGIKLSRKDKTMSAYVNDAIDYQMLPEQTLYYSDNCFGTADAISFRRRKLRIHDLKTGLHKASARQLEVYAALFCLEYGVSPQEIEIELRIYQNETVQITIPSAETIMDIMDTIIMHDHRVEMLKADELSLYR